MHKFKKAGGYIKAWFNAIWEKKLYDAWYSEVGKASKDNKQFEKHWHKQLTCVQQSVFISFPIKLVKYLQKYILKHAQLKNH